MKYKDGFSPKHLEVIYNTSNYRLIELMGSVASGKTVSSIYWYVRQLLTTPYPKGEHISFILGYTLSTINNNIRPIFEQLMYDLTNKLGYDFRRVDRFDYKLILDKDTVINIRCIGMSNIGALEAIRGVTLSGASIGDELLAWNSEAFKMLLSRLRGFKPQLMLTYNPGNGMSPNEEYMQALRKNHDSHVFYHFTIEDNVKNLDPEYVKFIKGAYPINSAEYKNTS